jgi:hypothetical protein
MKQYNFELAMGATISEAVVQEIVTSVVEKQTGKKVKTIELTNDGARFTGYSVTFYTDVIVPKSFKPSKEFIPETFGETE